MGNEYRTTVFKAGDRIVVSLDQALGLEEGAEVIVRGGGDGVFLKRATYQPGEKIDLTGIAGSIPGIQRLSREEREFDDSPRAWDAGEHIDRPKRKFDITKVAGSATDLQPIRREDRTFDERPSAVGRGSGGDGPA